MSELIHHLSQYLPANQIIVDELRRLAYGTDASFYRLIPQVVAVVENENEARSCCCRWPANSSTPVTFRAAGTSLSGQAITDGVLALIGEGFATCELGADASQVQVGPASSAARSIAGSPRSAARSAPTRPRSTPQDRRHRRQQRLRHVLRHGAEQLPHPGRHARHAGRRHRARHRRPASVAAFPISHAVLLGELERLGRDGCAPTTRAGRAHPPQVQDQEHHRLQPQRAGRFRPTRSTSWPT
jgi:D-lactate dehydrogenase